MSRVGRPQALSDRERIDVGQGCETLWNRKAERRAWRAMDEQPGMGGVRIAQARTQMVPVTARRRSAAVRETIEDVAGDINDAMDGKRFHSVPITRPRGEKDRVKGAVIRWCRLKYGKAITPRMAQRCWDEFRALLATF